MGLKSSKVSGSEKNGFSFRLNMGLKSNKTLRKKKNAISENTFFRAENGPQKPEKRSGSEKNAIKEDTFFKTQNGPQKPEKCDSRKSSFRGSKSTTKARKTFVVPGEVLFKFDFSDILDTAIELRGIASMCGYLFTLYNSESTFVNATIESIVTMQRGIVQLGLQALTIIQKRVRGEWPLDDVDYKIGPINDLDGFRVINGNGGINQDGLFVPNDGLAEHFPGCGRRINYATNYDDIRNFERDIHGCDQWSVYNAIRNFIAKCKNLTYLNTYMSTLCFNILGFYASLNEHYKTHWYSAFRSSQQTQAARKLVNSQRSAVRYTVRGKTLLHLTRSLSGKGLKANHMFEDIINLSSGGIRVMCEFASEMSVIDQMINHLDIDEEFTSGEKFKISGF